MTGFFRPLTKGDSTPGVLSGTGTAHPVRTCRTRCSVGTQGPPRPSFRKRGGGGCSA